MQMLFVFTAVGLVLFLIGLAALIWSIRTGQMDDLETPAMRMLHDDAKPKSTSSQSAAPQNSNAKTSPTSSPSEPS